MCWTALMILLPTLAFGTDVSFPPQFLDAGGLLESMQPELRSGLLNFTRTFVGHGKKLGENCSVQHHQRMNATRESLVHFMNNMTGANAETLRTARKKFSQSIYHILSLKSYCSTHPFWSFPATDLLCGPENVCVHVHAQAQNLSLGMSPITITRATTTKETGPIPPAKDSLAEPEMKKIPEAVGFPSYPEAEVQYLEPLPPIPDFTYKILPARNCTEVGNRSRGHSIQAYKISTGIITVAMFPLFYTLFYYGREEIKLKI